MPDLIAGTLGLTTGAALLPTDAVADMSATMEDVIFGRVTVVPLPDQHLGAQLAAANADLWACRYSQLARRLPRLLAQATAGRDQAPADRVERASGRLSQTYGLATQLLIKLHDYGMAWSTSDRAFQAAHASGDPLIVAEASRLSATRATPHLSPRWRPAPRSARRAATRRPTGAFQALLSAERETPQVVLYRPWAQNLTRN